MIDVYVMDILALMFVIICLVLSFKIYMLLRRSGTILWLISAFAYSTFLRSVMVICDIGKLRIPTNIIGGLFFVMYILFMFGMIGMFIAIKRMFKGGKK